jgi:sugar transferase (PEP-CTERM/EpsH1 system associated)
MFSNPAVASALAQWQAIPFDAQLASASSLAPWLRGRSGRPCRTIVDFVDVDSAKWADYASQIGGPKSWLYRLEARRVAKLEQQIGTWADAVSVVSAAEAGTLREREHPGPVIVASNGVDLEYWQPRPDTPTDPFTVAFVGVMDYRPNVDAVGTFLRPWQRLLERFPQARLQVIGRSPTKGLRTLPHFLPSVEIVGAVPDVREYLARATVSIAPLRLGRGVQNKVLEAMAMGKAIVASPRALAGIPCEPGHDLLLATTPDEWVESIGQLFQNAERQAQLGANARKYVERQHCWNECLAPVTQALLTGEIPI